VGTARLFPPPSLSLSPSLSFSRVDSLFFLTKKRVTGQRDAGERAGKMLIHDRAMMRDDELDPADDRRASPLCSGPSR